MYRPQARNRHSPMIVDRASTLPGRARQLLQTSRVHWRCLARGPARSLQRPFCRLWRSSECHRLSPVLWVGSGDSAIETTPMTGFGLIQLAPLAMAAMFAIGAQAPREAETDDR